MTDFNSMPIQLEKALQELQAIKAMVAKLQKQDETPKRLTFDKALEFLNAQSFECSKSFLYKKVASKQIPHYHFSNRIVFDTKELMNWAEQQLRKGKYYGK